MTFDVDKKNALGKCDKSKKGSIDPRIKPLCDLINSLKDHYTTSSCSGRIILMTLQGKKDQTDWIYVTHEIANLKEIEDALKKMPKEDVWFRFEPLILHIACRDIPSAEKMLSFVRDAGFKRSGIIGTQKMVIELIGTECIDCPIAEEGKLVITQEYLSFLVNTANRNMVKNEENIDKLFKRMLKLKSG